MHTQWSGAVLRGAYGVYGMYGLAVNDFGRDVVQQLHNHVFKTCLRHVTTCREDMLQHDA